MFQSLLIATSLLVNPTQSLFAGHPDWLLDPAPYKTKITVTPDKRAITLTNGLIKRVWRLTPNAATVALDNLMTCESMLRAVKPEAKLTLDGKEYSVGGLIGQPNLAYLRPEWLDQLKADPNALQFTGWDRAPVEERFAWKRVRHAANMPWPPPGQGLVFHFQGPNQLAVDVHYEMYDGIPLVAKWVLLNNGGVKAVRLDRFTSEVLAFAEFESAVGEQKHWDSPNVYVFSDYAFGGDTTKNANHTTFWETDPSYQSQVNYDLKTPNTLESRPPLGPAMDIPPGGSFETFRTFELLYDSTERERKGLDVRRAYKTLAPWVTESPLMLHLTSTDPQVVHRAIDQCAEVGFEMVIFSFGSGLNMEDDSEVNIRKFREFSDYAHSKGLQIGGYSLLASRRISDEDDVIDPETKKPGKAIFGNSPCLGSRWADRYFAALRTFLVGTHFDLLEHDGSYPGDVCASTTHPGHKGLEDSQWTQFQKIVEFYRWCRAQGIFLNVPDWYFLEGSNKSGMGYRETNWSLPREEQIVLARQNMYDGTWEKTPTMGWMFCPLVEYQGGGAAATIEPLSEHLDAYGAHLRNYVGFGVQACYRGPRLYDSPKTEALVKKWVSFFKEHRDILECDIVHVRRANGRDLDIILHVNPKLTTKGFAMIYNPTSDPITEEVMLSSYYTGLSQNATIQIQDGKAKTVPIDPSGRIHLSVTVPSQGAIWLTIR